MKLGYVLYPWVNGTNNEFIHPNDLEEVKAIGIAQIIGIEGEYCILSVDNAKIRARPEGIIAYLPTPKFNIGDKVKRIDDPLKIGNIKSFFWHHKDKQYFYFLEHGETRSSRRHAEHDLILINE